MKEFTCTEAELKHIDAASGLEVFMKAGEKRNLPVGVVEYFCRLGWGTSEGVTVGARKPGVNGKYVQLKATTAKSSGG